MVAAMPDGAAVIVDESAEHIDPLDDHVTAHGWSSVPCVRVGRF
jgi:hypothetical protein